MLTMLNVCPFCRREDRTSELCPDAYVRSTCMAVSPGYFDEAGEWVPERDPNWHTRAYTCSRGHRFDVRRRDGEADVVTLLSTLTVGATDGGEHQQMETPAISPRDMPMPADPSAPAVLCSEHFSPRHGRGEPPVCERAFAKGLRGCEFPDSAQVGLDVRRLLFLCEQQKKECSAIAQQCEAGSELAAEYTADAAQWGALRAQLVALVEAKALLDRMKLYRAPCWDIEPGDDPPGLERVGWLSALLSDVRSWIAQYPAIRDEHADADALEEGINEVEFLCDGLKAAIRAELAAAPPAPPFQEEASNA